MSILKEWNLRIILWPLWTRQTLLKTRYSCYHLVPSAGPPPSPDTSFYCLSCTVSWRTLFFIFRFYSLRRRLLFLPYPLHRPKSMLVVIPMHSIVSAAGWCDAMVFFSSWTGYEIGIVGLDRSYVCVKFVRL